MSSICSIMSSNSMPKDLAEKIGISGVNEILLTFWEGLKMLQSNPSYNIDITTDEDDITLAWYQQIQLIWDSRNRATTLCLNHILPIHQYPDNTMKKKGKKAPTIDFCYKDWQTQNSYFGAECKNLYNNNSSKIKRYVETGVINYTTGRYGSGSSKNAIVGYVLSGDIPSLVSKLIAKIDTMAPISNLSRDWSFLNPQYKSEHTRTLDGKDITIYHLFFDFVKKTC